MKCEVCVAVLTLACAAPGTSLAQCPAPQGGQPIPALFADGRVLASWHLHNGRSLLLYLDTGGNTWLYPDALTQLGAPIDTVVQSGYTRLSVRVSTSLGDSLVLPVPIGSAPFDLPDSATITVTQQPAPDYGIGRPVAGVLGGYWFAGRVWLIDYVHHLLTLDPAMPPSSPECWVTLGFQTYAPTGARTTQFPRIPATIDGVEIQFLLDLGARTTLTDSAWHTVGTDHAQQRAASFISQSRFAEWQQRHPDWLVVPRAEDGDSEPMIRVPHIHVGNHDIGPVWFTRRADRAFHEFISQYMDLPVEGALGGSVWQDVVLVIDYPRARAAVWQGGH